MVAGGQHRLPVGPRGAFDLELGYEGIFPRLGVVLRLPEQLLLLGQLCRQQIALLGEPVPLVLLRTTSSVGHAQLLLEGGVGA